MILRLRTGPEDWRLAYISFGLFVVGVARLPLFGFFTVAFAVLTATPTSLVLIVASYLVARATISESRDPKELKAQRWLLYPSLILVHSLLSILLLLWPLALLGNLARGMEHSVRRSYEQFADDLDYWCVAWFSMMAVLGAWWTILGAKLGKWQKLQSALLGLFGISLRRKWIRTFSLIGSVLMFLSICAGVLYYRYLT